MSPERLTSADPAPARTREEALTLGAETSWGKVAAIAMLNGERYYFMVSQGREVSMLPAAVVEGRALDRLAEPEGEVDHMFAGKPCPGEHCRLLLDHLKQRHGCDMRAEDPDYGL